MNRLQRNLTTGIWLVLFAIGAARAEEAYELDIAHQELSSALKLFAEQSGLQVVYFADLTAGKQSKGVHGTYSADAALAELLDDTDLTYSSVDERTYSIASPAAAEDKRGDSESGKGRSAWAASTATAAAGVKTSAGRIPTGPETPPEQRKGEEGRLLEEVIVTGTRIRGAQPSSPLITITQEEMRLAGHNNLGDVIRSLPQNFSGGQNPAVATGATAGGEGNTNFTGASSLNLRGLGADATLSLLNGSRLPYDGLFQATDVSVIPLAAIDRMEVLLDGASAIYGSDAVGGVVNIVLKRDYEGAELSVRNGRATDGGYEQQQYTAIAGTGWESGGFLITGDASRNTSVRADQRSYLSHLLPGFEVYPSSNQKGALFSGHQSLGDLAELTLDAFYTDRESTSFTQFSVALSDVTMDSKVWGLAPAFRVEVPGEWSLRIHGVVGQNETARETILTFVSTGGLLDRSHFCYCNKTEAAGVEAEGPLFTLTGGQARLSIGGGYRRNSFRQPDFIADMPVMFGSDRAHYLYSELNLPLISQDQAVPLVRQLSLNGAVRYESYDSFGDTTTPKVGATWSLTPGFDLRASWGRSFKVPSLAQQFADNALNLFPGTSFGAPVDSQVMLFLGGNPDLGPERAEIFTTGFTVTPEFAPDLSLEVNWFDIDYVDRVQQPITPVFSALTTPAYAELLTINPTLAEQETTFSAAGRANGSFDFVVGGIAYDPALVRAIVDNRFSNVAIQDTSGIDVSVRYDTGAFGGIFSLSGNGSWLDSTRKVTSQAPAQAATGVIYFPPEFRGRFVANWSRDGFTLSASVNHIGGVRNTNITPNPKGSSMTTLDVVVDYQAEFAGLGDMGFNLAVTNLSNRRPPFLEPLQPFYVNYDSTNYSALGRVVSATVTKSF